MFEVKTKCIIHNFAFFFLETFDCVNTHDHKWYGQVTYEQKKKKKKKKKIYMRSEDFSKKCLNYVRINSPFHPQCLKGVLVY